MDAAIATLKKEGFVGASARAIAEQAGSNQSLIFYHFGSVANLLLAALDAVSIDRLEHYSTMVTDTGSPSELVDTATDIFRTDLDAGYITVLVEMIAGASSTPDLGPEVAARIEPWREFAQTAIEDSLGDSPLGTLLPAADVAYAVVALYLGLEMLSHLDGNREPALNLFAHARQLAQLLEAISGTSAPEVPA
ncbi:MAG: TetR family transcriptional regulator [Acidimicrobiales bacterium]